MQQKEWIDKTNEIADTLESQARRKYLEEIEKAKSYCEGYTQACEDYARAMRSNIYRFVNEENINESK